MNQSSKVNSQGKVPFSFENKTGFPMVTNQKSAKEEKYLLQKLPLPPCLSENTKKSFHDIQIPFPPCTFQPSPRSCSRKGLERHDQGDPFFGSL
ncbi:hypothetical protein SLEP1_g30208 [Rubroshorea leprosula]|uniref:Uncharacterized protein n=1 Tax=Rubroshorea leprosula TaxID=152421 RepID=A0AAV5K833_9ROSI|nr:hypothetical protein SLEP1_g30208 [Rubroshorea leprosula]